MLIFAGMASPECLGSAFFVTIEQFKQLYQKDERVNIIPAMLFIYLR